MRCEEIKLYVNGHLLAIMEAGPVHVLRNVQKNVKFPCIVIFGI